jgi:hypothetical protein
VNSEHSERESTMTRNASATATQTSTKSELAAARQRLAELNAIEHPGEARRRAEFDVSRLEQLAERDRAEQLAEHRDPEWRAKLQRARAALDAATAELDRLRAAAFAQNAVRSGRRGVLRGWIDMSELDLAVADRAVVHARSIVRDLEAYPSRLLAAHDARFKTVEPVEAEPELIPGLTLRPRLRDRDSADANRVTVDPATVVESVHRAAKPIDTATSRRARATTWDGFSS